MPPATTSPALLYFGQYFPELRQTFVRDEIAGLRARGVRVVTVGVRAGTSTGFPEAQQDEAQDVIYLPAARSLRFWGAVIAAWLRRPVLSTRLLLRVLRCRGELTGQADRARLFGYAVRGLALASSIRSDPRLAGVTHLHAHFDEYPLFSVVVAAAHCDRTYSYTMHTTSDAVGLALKAENAAFIAAVSLYALGWLVERIPATAATAELVRCGLRGRDWHVERSPREPPLVLAVGALIPVKGHDVLLRAARLLADRRLPFELLIVGEGEGRGELEALLEALDLRDRARIAGAVPRAEVRRLLGEATLFALACNTTEQGDRDGIPVSLMEAMAAEVAVVSTRLSGIPELVEDGVSGRLVSPGDPVELAAALEELLVDEPLRSRLAAAGREAVAREFDLESQVDCMHRLFGRVGALRSEEQEGQ